MWSFTQLLLALSLFRVAYAVPAVVVTTSTRLTTITSCSCTSISSSARHTSTISITNSASCTSKKLKPTCKTTTSTIKSTITSTSSTKSSSSTKTSTSTKPPTTSSPSPKPTSTSTATPKSSTTSTSSSTSATPTPNTGKRGLSYNDATLTAPFSLSGQSSKVSWTYNWYSYPYTIGQTATGYNPALSFTPMLWSSADVLASVWSSNVASSIAKYGTNAVLAFNEPDGCGGGGSSCMNVSSAVSAYQTYMDPLAGKVRLGAPAVTNGAGPTMGLSYLKDFLGNCTGCTVDFVPVHWYGDAGNSSGFEWYVTQASAVAHPRPIWVTEFGTTSGSAEQTQLFLQTVMAWMDGQSWVEKYAWFMDAPGNLINANGSGLSVLGGLYNSG